MSLSGLCVVCGRRFPVISRSQMLKRKTCSRACRAKRVASDFTFQCAACGTPLPNTKTRRHKARLGQERQFCSTACQIANLETHPRFKNGGVLPNGYREVAGELEHRRIVERILGRSLPSTVPIHHVDENRSNNANTNLVVCQDAAYHRLLHARTRLIRAGGKPGRDKLCGACRRALPLTEFSPRKKRGRPSVHVYCRPCTAARARRIRQPEESNAEPI